MSDTNLDLALDSLIDIQQYFISQPQTVATTPLDTFVLPGELVNQENHPVESSPGWNKSKRISKRRLDTCKMGRTDECAICLQEIKKNAVIHKLACRHQFHRKCLNQWITKQQSTCPMCRKDIYVCS